MCEFSVKLNHETDMSPPDLGQLLCSCFPPTPAYCTTAAVKRAYSGPGRPCLLLLLKPTDSRLLKAKPNYHSDLHALWVCRLFHLRPHLLLFSRPESALSRTGLLWVNTRRMQASRSGLCTCLCLECCVPRHPCSSYVHTFTCK